MCELCPPRVTRRSALTLVGGAALAALALPRTRPAAAERSYRTGYGVDIRPRESWAGVDRPFDGVVQSEDVRFLLVHHTGGPSDGDPAQIIRGIHAFHTGPAKGWPDVAYNFFVDPDGAVHEGRTGSLDDAVEASATGGNQGFAQLVCLLGDFTSQQPTDAALASLNATLAWLADRYGLDTSPGATASFTSRGSNLWPAGTEVTAAVVSGHRDMSRTACPGDTFYPYLVAEVQRAVDALRGNPAPTSTSDGAIRDPVADTTTSPTTSPTTTPTITTIPPSITTPDDTVPATTPDTPEAVADSTAVPTTVRSTVAAETAGSAPRPVGDDWAVGAPAEVPTTSSGRSSANSTAVTLGVAAVAGTGAVVGLGAIRARRTGRPAGPPSGTVGSDDSGGVD